MDTLIMTAQFLLGLSLLIGLHEWGHYITARMFNIRVERFYLFFDFLFPLPNVMNFALFKFKRGETEYGLGWFPLGGYVKIAGMMDESMDKEQMAAPVQPWEFRAKPAWQRLIVMLGGIIVNVILGVAIFIGLSWSLGESGYKLEEVNRHGIYVSEVGASIGLQTGDKILSVNGQPTEDFADLRNPKVLMTTGSYYTVLRGDNQLRVDIPADFIEKLSDAPRDRPFIEALEPFSVGEVSPGSLAERIGLQKGDRILSLNDSSVRYFQLFNEAKTRLAGKPFALAVLRGADTLRMAETLPEDGKLGFYPQSELQTFTKEYSLGESVVKGTANAFGVIGVQLQAFGKIFSGQLNPSKALSGPIGIARMYGTTFDWVKFWTFTGMLSMVLAFMNLLPIPALDGGHALITLYEMATGREPSEKFLEITQRIGMVILLGLMFFALGNDLIKAIFD